MNLASLLKVINMHGLLMQKLIVFQVNGGSQFSVKIRWSQKLLYHDGQVSLSVPFSFPAYVIPLEKKLSKKEKIYLNVNSGTATEVLCKSSSHPLKVKPVRL